MTYDVGIFLLVYNCRPTILDGNPSCRELKLLNFSSKYVFCYHSEYKINRGKLLAVVELSSLNQEMLPP